MPLTICDRDFPKALWAVTIAEILVFSLVGSIVYAYSGTNYITAPAFGSIGNELYLKVSFSFMIPTLIFLGVLYASVSARFLFFRIFQNAKHHIHDHTVVGWATWATILRERRPLFMWRVFTGLSADVGSGDLDHGVYHR